VDCVGVSPKFVSGSGNGGDLFAGATRRRLLPGLVSLFLFSGGLCFVFRLWCFFVSSSMVCHRRWCVKFHLSESRFFSFSPSIYVTVCLCSVFVFPPDSVLFSLSLFLLSALFPANVLLIVGCFSVSVTVCFCFYSVFCFGFLLDCSLQWW
jgi:hypothetical protein